MQPLDKQLRSKLENTVTKARDIAEAGALAALQQLGVGLKEADAHLTEPEKDLRRRLRAHGRQLGDLRTASAEQELMRLAEEIAYEHWHRMLFAQFLAENNLLMYPDPDEPVAVSLNECDEMAADEGARNGWELAARYAAQMLPQIFKPDSPSFELELPPEYEGKLEKLLAGLDAAVFQASDSLGWVYQFWQAKRKEEVNERVKSGDNVGARELPAVTQLFTEPYMVSFLLDNSLGAWWAGQRLSADDLKGAQSEAELREKAALPEVPLEYLRFVQDEDTKTWAPAGGTFESWPKTLGELKTLDPCCGSGHFLVSTFLMLVPMRMQLEGLTAQAAVDAVLRENIHGLELDARCVELAAFALAFTAWRYPDAGGYRPLPELQVACSGLSISVAKEEWKDLVNGDRRLRIAMDWLYDTFADAPELGSLLDPARSDATKLIEWEKLSHEFVANTSSNEQRELGVVAEGLTKAAELLSISYDLIATNVPYKKKGELNIKIQKHLEDVYPTAKTALETCFLLRARQQVKSGGLLAMVLPHNWLFLKSYINLRSQLLESDHFRCLAWLGDKAFHTPLGVSPILLHLEVNSPSIWTEKTITSVSVCDSNTVDEKIERVRTVPLKILNQKNFLETPDHRITYGSLGKGELLSKIALTSHGQGCFDTPRFTFCFWEILNRGNIWVFQQSSPSKSMLFDGSSYALRWEEGQGAIYDLMEAKKKTGYTTGKWRAGIKLWGKPGVLIRQVGDLPSTMYLGSSFDDDTAVIAPADEKHLPALWCYCSSDDYHNDVRVIDQSLKVTNTTLGKVPFDLEHWTKVAEEKYPNGLPKPYSNDPTQWIFHGDPVGSDDPLQVAVARLIGYQWPAERDAGMELSDEARAKITESAKLLPFADEDGIACIPAVRGEAAAADRLRDLLAAAYGEQWTNQMLQQLLADANHAGKPLELWLREKFFTQHCKRFQHRPFIWHIWDGLRDGFAALVNYHTFDAKALETLIYTYLGDWISRQQEDQRNGIDGAAEKLAAAENLKKRLELIQQGEPPYDIFVRWKPLDAQPLGWAPDLNDGVRLNIRPFLMGDSLGKKGSGILRDKPNVKWTKDRGKDVESAPWYPVHNGDRINDHHLTRAEKEAARNAGS